MNDVHNLGRLRAAGLIAPDAPVPQAPSGLAETQRA